MKKMSWKALLLLIAAVPVVNFVAGRIGGSAAEAVNAREKGTVRASPASKEIRIIVSSQDLQGLTQEQMDLDFLKWLESYTVERVTIKAKEYLASVGQADVPINMTSEATYVQS